MTMPTGNNWIGTPSTVDGTTYDAGCGVQSWISVAFLREHHVDAIAVYLGTYGHTTSSVRLSIYKSPVGTNKDLVNRVAFKDFTNVVDGAWVVWEGLELLPNVRYSVHIQNTSTIEPEASLSTRYTPSNIDTEAVSYSKHVDNDPNFVLTKNPGDRAFATRAYYPPLEPVKRWTGSDWVVGKIKRYNAPTSTWVETEMVRQELSPRRYWDTSAYMPLIDSATTIAQLEAIPNEMEEAYGMDLRIQVSSPDKEGYATSPMTINDQYTKPMYKLMVEQLSKYPRGFILQSRFVESMSAALDLTHYGSKISGTTFQTSDDAIVAAHSVPYVHPPGGEWRTPFHEPEMVFHHEMFHSVWKSWQGPAANWGLTEAGWSALMPNSYYGIYWQEETERYVRPQGHLRDYGAFNFEEDAADIWGAIMSDSMQPYLAQVCAEDPIVAYKVQNVKDTWAEISKDMRRLDYYSALFEPEA